MICSSCGCDNPREHRYCGMCGTPFPHRPLTVPASQSTLAFSKTPIEVGSSFLAVHAVEPPPSAIDVAEPPTATTSEVVEEAPILAEAIEHAPTVAEQRVAVPPETPQVSGIPDSVASLEPSVILPSPEPRTVEDVAAAASPALAEPEPSVELFEPVAIEPIEDPTPTADEPAHEAAHAAEAAAAEPAVEPHSPEPPEPAVPIQVPEEVHPIVESAPTAPEPLREEAQPAEIRRPTPPPETYVVARPVTRPRQAPPPRTVVTPKRPAAIHPSPDSLPITPPPESAGMPTFQSVVDAAGAPSISPFEPSANRHVDEDEELKEFVANFFYKPPDESIDELTMRSEVPVIDKEEPAQFHHAAFDDDVPPPPEAGAHTATEPYVAPVDNDTNRPRFLDITEHPQKPVSDQPRRVPTGSPFLHVDDSASSKSLLDEAFLPAKSRWLLWSSLAALLLIFGSLGFLEGRAEMTHEFRGPLEIAREQYGKLRQRISQMPASAPGAAPAPAANTNEPDKQSPTQSEPVASQTPTPSNPQPGNAPQSATSTTLVSAPVTAEQEAQSQNPSPQPAAKEQSAAAESGSEPNSTEVAKSEPPAPKPLDAPSPKPSGKPQPGQAELAKALGASDSAAAAAWLWRATSRGNPEAPVRLADMYIKGKGVPHSCEQALVLLRSAAMKPNAPARNRLAALYANGTCVARDRVRAYEFLSEALQADPTSDWAQQRQKDLWNQMTPAERAEVQKFR